MGTPSSEIVDANESKRANSRLLVDSGADIDKGAINGLTPLYIASQEDRVDVS